MYAIHYTKWGDRCQFLAPSYTIRILLLTLTYMLINFKIYSIMSHETSSLLSLTELPAPSVIMMAGVPGSGKSYLAEQLGELLDMPVISSDACREELSGDANDQSVSRQAWELVYHKAEMAIHDGTSVIIDGTHKSPEQRRNDIRRYRDFGAHTVAAVHVMTSLHTALTRNAARERVVPDAVIQHMHDMLTQTPPEERDGFDFVVRLYNE